MKKYIVFMLLITFVCVFPVAINAASGICGDNLIWKLNSDTLVISGTGDMYDYSTMTGDAPWYANYALNIKKVIIENGVTSIGRRAFIGCQHLTDVTIADTVINIGDNAFESCYKLKSITIPESVTSVGRSVFYYCHALETVNILGNVKELTRSTFSDCKSLTSINVALSNDHYSTEQGILFDKNKTTLIMCPENTAIKTYIIPNSVTTIGSAAFYGCGNLNYISIPDSVTTIGNSAFSRCSNLDFISIPDSVTLIGSSAFDGCNGNIVYEGSENDWIRIKGQHNTQLTATYNCPIFTKNALINNITATKTNYTTYQWRFSLSIKYTAPNSYAYVVIYDNTGKMLSAKRTSLASGVATIDIYKVDDAAYAKIFAWYNYRPIAPDVKINL